MSKTKKIKLFINTIKYLKPSQFVYRASFIFKRKLISKLGITKFYYSKRVKRLSNKEVKVSPIISRPLNLALSDSECRLLFDEIEKYNLGEFTFLNKTFGFQSKLGWNDPSISQLWRYNLHYFDYLRDLCVANITLDKELTYNLVRKYVIDWIDNNREIGIGDGWHPYTISLRLVNFIFAYSLLEDQLNNDSTGFKYKFIESILLQSLFLRRNLEYDVYGNHLFENAKALIIAGLFFKKETIGEALLKCGQTILLNEFNEQVLEDGGHFERSPMYHCIVLKGLMEVIYCYKNSFVDPPQAFNNKINEMINFLTQIIQPDKKIPLFNDSAFGISDDPKYLFAYATSDSDGLLSNFDKVMKGNNSILSDSEINPNIRDRFFAKESGYLVSRDKMVYVIYDFGKPCPDYLPAHAHADLFSYELSIGYNRVIVDSGTYEYAQGEMRDYNRSTAAHNTVAFKGENQSEVWGSFRVGNRAQPQIQIFNENDNYIYLSASHDGYQKKFGVIHTRHFIHVKDRAIIFIDELIGKTRLDKEECKSLIHIAPEISYKNDYLYNENSERLLKVNFINSSITKVKNGSYSPEFSRKIPIQTLELIPELVNQNQCIFGYYYTLLDEEISITQNSKKIIISIQDIEPITIVAIH